MSWFDRISGASLPGFGKDGPASLDAARRARVPEGVWQKCEGCGAALYGAEMRRNLNVCPRCQHHHALPARARLEAFLDPAPAPRTELARGITATDPLHFKDSRRYPDRLAEARQATGEEDALVVMRGRLEGQGVVASAFEFGFMGGSMGSAVGEKFTRGVEAAIAEAEPFLCFTASGGARMQESLFSLMQMAKTSAALAELAARGLPYVVVLANPTMGGVSASLAMLGDLTLAEPGALIGFAGPRVIEQTVRQKLPEGFQKAEFLREKGAIDQIVDRRELRSRVSALLSMLTQRPTDTGLGAGPGAGPVAGPVAGPGA